MSAGKFAALAGGAVVALVVGTFAFTQIMQPANRFEACLGGSVAGGSIGGPFTLVSETGQQVTDKDVITQPTLVYFGYTFCPDVCPLDTNRNAIAVDILSDADHMVTPVLITIDPERDTPEYLAEYTDNFHPDMLGLSGSKEQIAQAARAYKVYYKRQPSDDPDYYLMDHSSFTYLMLPEHGFVDFFRSAMGPEEMAERVGCFLDAA